MNAGRLTASLAEVKRGMTVNAKGAKDAKDAKKTERKGRKGRKED
jgi:hypothetical protein